MKAVLITHGSTGDTVPMIALASALKSEGHEVALLISPAFSGLAEANLPASDIHFIPPRDHQELVDLMHRFSGLTDNLRLIRAMYREMCPGLPEVVATLEQALSGAHLLVVSSLFPFYRHLARRRNIPTLALHFCHNSLPDPWSPPDPIPPLPRWSGPLARAWSSLWWWSSNRILDFSLNRVAADRFQQVDLPPLHNWLLRPAEYSAFLVSPTLFTPPTPLRAHQRMTGFLELRRHHHAPSDTDSENTTLPGVPLLTFGSMSTPDLARQLEQFLNHPDAPLPIVIQRGWAQLETRNRPGVHGLGPAPHHRIFPQAGVIIHHGGAGTTAAALRAGVPQIIIPFFADQPFWSREIEKLGCGLSVSRQHWPDRLPAAIREIQADASYGERAREAAAKLASEAPEQELVRFCEAIIVEWLSG